MWGSGGIASPILTSVQGGGEWTASRSGHFTPGEIASGYPLDTRFGGPQSRSGHYREEKSLASAGNRTPAVLPVASRYTN
jgi:hypothetical protein